MGASVPTNQELLDAVNCAIKYSLDGGGATAVGVVSYSVEGMSLTRHPLDSLMRLRNTLQDEINAGRGIAKTLIEAVRL